MTSAAEARGWAAKHVEAAAIGWDKHGRVADFVPEFTSVRVSWFHDHGLGGMFRGDEMWLDDAGLVRYRRLRDLADGTTAYERVGEGH